MRYRRIVITGAKGQLGAALCRQLGPAALPLTRAELPLEQLEQIGPTIARLAPDAVIHCAAYVQVDQAETEPEACFRLNAHAVAALAEACQAANAKLVQISTDYIFGGAENRATPHREDDPPTPQGVYAASKLAGEQAAASCPQNLIVRTCGLYGATPKRNNFVETMLRLARERDRLRVVNDQRCTPSYAEHVAAGILRLLEQDAAGIVHVVNSGNATWFEFATEIFRQPRWTRSNIIFRPI